MRPGEGEVEGDRGVEAVLAMEAKRPHEPRGGGRRGERVRQGRGEVEQARFTTGEGKFEGLVLVVKGGTDPSKGPFEALEAQGARPSVREVQREVDP
jgi:hypothetical protein